MPLPSLKLRLLNSKLAGNAHFELAQADVPADLDFTNSQLLSFHTESGTFLVCFVFMWPVFLSLFLIERSFLTRYLRFRFPSRLLNLFLPWCARQRRGSLAFFSLADLLQLAILINIIIEIGANSIEIGRT